MLVLGLTFVWSGPAYWDQTNSNNPLNGTFDIKNVPPGNYNLAVWDRPQNYLIDGFNITVGRPGTVSPEVGVNASAPGSANPAARSSGV